MSGARSVTCPKCGFSVEDRGILEWPILAGDRETYLHQCRFLDDAPSPPTQVFYCIALRTAAKRAAMTAEIQTTRTLTPVLIRSARALLDWTQGDLAQRANLSVAGVSDIEMGERKPHFSTLARIESALKEAGVIFSFDPLPGVRLKGGGADDAAIPRSQTPTPAQIRAARALLGWSQEDLCQRATLSVPTLIKAEREGPRPRSRALISIQRALEAAGVEFTNGDEPGVKLRKQG